MKKILLSLALAITVLGCFSSCITTAQAYSNDSVIVEGDTCYVYYNNPSNSFLNTLHVVDGAYFYWYINRYIPVVFPYWDVWSPYRYFYYDMNRWKWRDRYHNYNHFDYRRFHYWRDYRHHRLRMNKYMHHQRYDNPRPYMQDRRVINRPTHISHPSRNSFGNRTNTRVNVNRNIHQQHNFGHGSSSPKGRFGGRI